MISQSAKGGKDTKKKFSPYTIQISLSINISSVHKQERRVSQEPETLQ